MHLPVLIPDVRNIFMICLFKLPIQSIMTFYPFLMTGFLNKITFIKTSSIQLL